MDISKKHPQTKVATMHMEPINAVTTITIKEIAGHDEIGAPVAYVNIKDSWGGEFPRIMTLRAMDSYRTLTTDLDDGAEFNLEMLYRTPDSAVCYDIIIITL